jgi:hypothetical protein
MDANADLWSMDPFEDRVFIGAVRRWEKTRGWIAMVRPAHREQPSDNAHLFCAKMFCAFHGNLDPVREYLESGRRNSEIKRAFRRAQKFFYEQELNKFRIRGRWGDARWELDAF